MRALDTPCSILLQLHTKIQGVPLPSLYQKNVFLVVFRYFGIREFENIGHFGILAIRNDRFCHTNKRERGARVWDKN